MATIADTKYCEITDLLDLYPALSEFDLKRRLYNFRLSTAGVNFFDSTLDIYYLGNTGYIQELFQNGNQVKKITYSVGTFTVCSGAPAAGAATIAVDDSSSFADNDFIRIGPSTAGNKNVEYCLVSGISDGSPDTISMARGIATTTSAFPDDTPVYRLWDATSDLPDSTSDIDYFAYLYDEDYDALFIVSEGDPNDFTIEAGDRWDNLRARMIKKASRLIETYLDSRVAKYIVKDREGNYPEIIVHATALQTILLLLKAHDPNNEIIPPFQSELDDILEGIKSGQIVLPTNVSSDSSLGTIRTIQQNSSSSLYPVELHGIYTGHGYDLIKVKVIDGGVIGTATYSVWVKGADDLKSVQVVTAQKITGDYDYLGNGLSIRFSGVTDSASAVANDEYEIEVFAQNINSTVSSTGSIQMTRR